MRDTCLRTAFALTLLVCAVPLYAQTGGIAGAVSSPSGAVSGALVQVSGPTLDTPRSAHTDAVGRYTVQGLPAGRYRVTFAAGGFDTQVLEDVTVAEGFTRVVSMKLGEGARTLRARIDPLTGPDAVDCGELPPGTSEVALQAALRCGLDAVERGETFRLVKYQTRRADGMTMSHGLIGISGGALVAYQYWSSACHGAACEDRFVTRACASPRVQGDAVRRPAIRSGAEAHEPGTPTIVLQSLGAHVTCEPAADPAR